MEARPDAVHETMLSLPTYLNAAIFCDARLVDRISQQLVAGRLVSIHRAFGDAYAEKMFQGLNAVAAGPAAVRDDQWTRRVFIGVIS